MIAKPTNKGAQIPLGEVLFEFQRVGNMLRVTAIDPKSGTEVISIADPRFSQDALKKRAATKLAYVMAKKKNKNRPS